MSKLWLFASACTVALTLAGCDNGAGTPNSVPPPVSSPTTLAAFVAQIFGNTSDTALPADLNAAKLDTSSEDATQFNALLI